MFNQDFYPTPAAVIERMLGNTDLLGKHVLEPSAGKGDLIDALTDRGAIVCCCENDPDLSVIAASKANLLAYDFLTLTADRISHIQAIYMNPPFSQAARHILHAWEIAPAGCHITALCNWETLFNTHTRERVQLSNTVTSYGGSVNLGSCFDTAERRTNVQVGLVSLFKPGSADEFGDYFTDEADAPELQGEGLMPYNVVRDTVGRYVQAVRLYDQVLDNAVRMNALVGVFHVGKLAFTCTEGEKARSREAFVRDLQKKAWEYVLNKMDMDRFTTRSLKADINRFAEQQQKLPFTMRNIYKMLEMVVGTHGSRMDRAITDVFDRATTYYHDNRHAVEGWKTNSHYLLGMKFILPHMASPEWSGTLGLHYQSTNVDLVEDLTKALCHLTATPYDSIGSLWNYLHRRTPETERAFRPEYVRYDYNTWYEWGFFRFKGFKKGTMHFQFLDEAVWATFNQAVARIKGYPLPESIRKSAEKTRAGQKNDKPSGFGAQPQNSLPRLALTAG
jgi:hypothetical protein